MPFLLQDEEDVASFVMDYASVLALAGNREPRLRSGRARPGLTRFEPCHVQQTAGLLYFGFDGALSRGTFLAWQTALNLSVTCVRTAASDGACHYN